MKNQDRNDLWSLTSLNCCKPESKSGDYRVRLYPVKKSG